MARVGAIGVIVAAALAADGETLNAAVDALGVAGGAFVAAVVLAAAARRGRRRELHSAAARPMTAGMSARVSATDVGGAASLRFRARETTRIIAVFDLRFKTLSSRRPLSEKTRISVWLSLSLSLELVSTPIVGKN